MTNTPERHENHTATTPERDKELTHAQEQSIAEAEALQENLNDLGVSHDDYEQIIWRG